MVKATGLVRREVLLPGNLLPMGRQCEGKHHGIVLRVEAPAVPGGYPRAIVQMTDFFEPNSRTRKLKVLLPAEQVLPFVLPKMSGGRAKRVADVKSKEQEWEKAAGVNYSIPRWAALDRERVPKKAKRAPDAPPLHGPQLQERLQQLEAAPPSECYLPGVRLWVRVPGSGLWPGVAWAFSLCKRRDWGQLVLSHRPGALLVRFYGQHSNMWCREEECELPPADEREHLRQLRAAGRQQNQMRLLELALSELEAAHSDTPCKADPELERRRMVQLYEQYLQTRQAPDNCYLCRELGAELECVCCDRLFHPVCLHYPAVSTVELPGGVWTCPCCAEEQKVREEGEGGEGEGDAGEIERMGLTPDWIIEAAAFCVFGLERPTAVRPYIAGLLDPCTNSKLAPNIPAEKLYDKQDNGLKLSNGWEGHYVLLNPDYRAQIQWRFVNRAIDEVENGQVPCVVLVCRNSTDTGYFQRLRPYPRVLLRRMSARFKDYDKTPIGFGIAVFCIAKKNVRELYARFYEAFESMGEPNIPVDRGMMQTDEFYRLLDRLRVYADQHHRDHWVQCAACSKWRIIDFRAAQQIGDDTEWSCDMLRPPFTSCQTPLSKNEQVGGHYAAGGADWAGPGNDEGEEEAGWAAGGGALLEAGEAGTRSRSKEGEEKAEAQAAAVPAKEQTRQQPAPVPAAASTRANVATAEPPAAVAIAAAGTVATVGTPVAAGGEGRRAQAFEPGPGSSGSVGSTEDVLPTAGQAAYSLVLPGPKPALPAVAGAAAVAGRPLVAGALPPAAFQPGSSLAQEQTLLAAVQAARPSLFVQVQQQQQQFPQPAATALPASSCGATRQPGDLPLQSSHMVPVCAGLLPPAPLPLLDWLLPSSPATVVDTAAAAAGPSAAAGQVIGKQQQQQPVLPHPLPPASQVVCASMLRELVRLPPRNISLDTEEGGGGQVLTALELARHARIAANRAYLAGLGLGPSAMNSGQVPSLAPSDPVMLAAARELASHAAVEQGRQQVEEVRRRYEAARRWRQREEPRLLAALRELQANEQAAWQQLMEAEHAAGELQKERHMQESRAYSQQQLAAQV